MGLRIVDDDTGLALDVRLNPSALEAFRIHLARLADDTPQNLDRKDQLAREMVQTVLRVVDPDLRPPTDPQLRFAQAIAADLGISIPADALASRGEMSHFIERHAPLFYSRRGARPT